MALFKPYINMPEPIAKKPLPNKITAEDMRDISKDRQKVFFLPIKSAIMPEGNSKAITVKE